MTESVLERGDARQLWAVLGAEGKAPTEIVSAKHQLSAYSVGIDVWVDRLCNLYLRELCRKNAHFKLVLAPYGGGKTHFLIELGLKALSEGFAVSYIPCGQEASLDNPLDIYRVFAKHIQLPNEDTPGIRNLLRRVVKNKRCQIEDRQAADPDVAFGRWLKKMKDSEYPENAFGRVMAVALKAEWDPDSAVSADAAIRWLQGDIDSLTKVEREELRLATITTKAKAEQGRNLLLSIARFVQEAGIHGVVLLFDEVETLFNARGKALLRVLSAMRVLVDIPNGVAGGVPMLGVFSAVPDVLNELGKYPALQQRLAVLGASFDQGNDFATQILLEKLGTPTNLLSAIGARLIDVGTLALGYPFDRELQTQNAKALAHVASERNLDVDARRLYVKTWVNILGLQQSEGERLFTDKELAARYQGFFDSLKKVESEDNEP